jgi:hypothetical protein
MNELAARKQALITQSEVHRQTLTLELDNLRLYIARQKRKFALLRLARPLLLLLPVLGPLLIRKKAVAAVASAPRSPWRRALSGGLIAWRLYHKLRPALHHAFARRRGRNGNEER